MPRTKLLKGSVSVTFRLPQQAREILAEKARREKLSVSELVRRALRREMSAHSEGRRPQMNAKLQTLWSIK